MRWAKEFGLFPTARSLLSLPICATGERVGHGIATPGPRRWNLLRELGSFFLPAPRQPRTSARALIHIGRTSGH